MTVDFPRGRRKSSGLEKHLLPTRFCWPVRRSKSLPRMQRKKSVHWSDALEDIHYFQPGTHISMQTGPAEMKRSNEKKQKAKSIKSPPSNSPPLFLGRRRSSLPLTTKTKFDTSGLLRTKEFHGSTKHLRKISEEREQVQDIIDIYDPRPTTLPNINPKDFMQIIKFEQGEWV